MSTLLIIIAILLGQAFITGLVYPSLRARELRACSVCSGTSYSHSHEALDHDGDAGWEAFFWFVTLPILAGNILGDRQGRAQRKQQREIAKAEHERELAILRKNAALIDEDRFKILERTHLPQKESA